MGKSKNKAAKAYRHPTGLLLYKSSNIKEQTKILFRQVKVHELEYVKENCFDLQSLDIRRFQNPNMPVCTELYCSIIAQNPNLIKCHIFNGTKDILKCILENCKNIQDIELAVDLPLREVKAVLEQYPQLMNLSLGWLTWERIAGNVDLTLRNCNDVDLADFVGSIDNVRKARFIRSAVMDDAVRQLILHSSVHLEILSVKDNLVSHDVLKEVLRSCPRLIHLEFCTDKPELLPDLFSVSNVLKLVKVYTSHLKNPFVLHDFVEGPPMSMSTVFHILQLCPHGNRFRFDEVTLPDSLDPLKKLFYGYRDERRKMDCRLEFHSHAGSLRFRHGKIMGTDSLDDMLSDDEIDHNFEYYSDYEQDWVSGDKELSGIFSWEEEEVEEFVSGDEGDDGTDMQQSNYDEPEEEEEEAEQVDEEEKDWIAFTVPREKPPPYVKASKQPPK